MKFSDFRLSFQVIVAFLQKKQLALFCEKRMSFMYGVNMSFHGNISGGKNQLDNHAVFVKKDAI